MLRIIITKAFSLYYYNLVLVIYQIRGEWGGGGRRSEEVLTGRVHPRTAPSSYSSLKTREEALQSQKWSSSGYVFLQGEAEKVQNVH